MNYDITSPKSLEQYAKLLIGKTFRDFIPKEHQSIGGKGKLGQYVEKYHFGYNLNNETGPDFPEAGVELKVTAYKALKKIGEFSSKERLSLNIINYMDIVNENFESSSFLRKNQLLLLIFYLYQNEQVEDIDFQINYAQLFTYPEVDLELIRQDWNIIVNKIKNGEAHELSEGDTLYLGAATKGAKTESNLRPQPKSDVMARQRAFSLKTKYMTHILRKYILTEKSTYDSIITSKSELESKTFTQLIADKLTPHYGRSIDDLCKEFNLNRKSKNVTSQAVMRLLGVQSNQAEEFVKANIVIKSIRIETHGKIKQHMSFPTFKFKELVEEEWEESTFRTTLAETKFFLVVYEFDKKNILRLRRCKFWNIPLSILDTEIKSVWDKTVSRLKSGVTLTQRGSKVYNNLPSASDSFYAHVRPHASKSAYVKESPYSDQLPNGKWMTKQSFWLNKEYILQVINE